MSILYKRYFDRLRLLRSSDVEENPGLRALRRSCCVVYVNVQGPHMNLSDLSLMARGGDAFFESLLSLPDATFPSLWF